MSIDRRHLICRTKSKYLVISFYLFLFIYPARLQYTGLKVAQVSTMGGLPELDRLRQDLTQLKMSVRLKETKERKIEDKSQVV